jgi:hypothetical protein
MRPRGLYQALPDSDFFEIVKAGSLVGIPNPFQLSSQGEARRTGANAFLNGRWSLGAAVAQATGSAAVSDAAGLAARRWPVF